MEWNSLPVVKVLDWLFRKRRCWGFWKICSHFACLDLVRLVQSWAFFCVKAFTLIQSWHLVKRYTHRMCEEPSSSCLLLLLLWFSDWKCSRVATKEWICGFSFSNADISIDELLLVPICLFLQRWNVELRWWWWWWLWYEGQWMLTGKIGMTTADSNTTGSGLTRGATTTANNVEGSHNFGGGRAGRSLSAAYVFEIERS